MSRTERISFGVLTVVCAATRPLAMARSPWAWDEMLFTCAARAYDVTQHHPHPPGYPLFIVLGKLARLIVRDDFRALQAVNLVAGALLFPAVFFLARELQLRFETAAIAGVLCAFLPTVWFYGGTAFSDVTSIVIIVFAAALLLRGSPAGAFLLGCAIAIRPQNLLIGLAPMRKRVRDAWLALIPVVLCYGGAAIASGGWSRFADACRYQSAYIMRLDSFRNPRRPPLLSLFERFFVMQYGWNPLSIAISLLVVVSIIFAIRRRDRGLLLNALTFGPFAIAAWLLLDPFSVRRYSIGYLPMFAIFAADGIERIARGRWRIVIASALVLASIAWTAPALIRVMREDSPPIAALKHLPDDLYVGYAMAPYVNRPYVLVQDEFALPLSPGKHWLLTEIDHTTPSGLVFSRPHDQLWQLAVRRYFTVALEPMTRFATFGEGWQPPERKDHDEWRWMGARSVMHLPPIRDHAYLRLAFDSPEPGSVEVRINGELRETVAVTPALLERNYNVPSADRDNIVELTLHGASRLRLRWLGWGSRR